MQQFNPLKLFIQSPRQKQVLSKPLSENAVKMYWRLWRYWNNQYPISKDNGFRADFPYRFDRKVCPHTIPSYIRYPYSVRSLVSIFTAYILFLHSHRCFPNAKPFDFLSIPLCLLPYALHPINCFTTFYSFVPRSIVLTLSLDLGRGLNSSLNPSRCNKKNDNSFYYTDITYCLCLCNTLFFYTRNGFVCMRIKNSKFLSPFAPSKT